MDVSTLPRHHILCVDMKSFYASCAAVKRGLDPMNSYIAVVADKKRNGSVVLAASPALKRDFGIQTGSRLYDIPDHPKIIIVDAEMSDYLQTSLAISELFHRYVPKECIFTYSVDESFLMMDGTERLWGNRWQAARRIQQEIKEQFGLPSAVGMGDNLLLAKLCLDLEAKTTKTGIALWTYEDVPAKLWPVRPLRRMWGIGSRLEKRLNRLGIMTVGQLAQCSLSVLEKKFGVMGHQLYYHAHGIDQSTLQTEHKSNRVSYDKGQILLRDYVDRAEIFCVLLEMCEEVAKRLREDQKTAKTIQLSIGYTHHTNKFCHRITLDEPTNITMDIYRGCKYLFEQYDTKNPVRQINISLTNLYDDHTFQLDLFEAGRIKQHKLGYVMDDIRKKYGSTSLLRAVSYTKGSTICYRSTLIGGHKA